MKAKGCAKAEVREAISSGTGWYADLLITPHMTDGN